ncbi:Lrp/AsnC family transcriptional regulator [[Eubacterium] cellulosolvens]
MSELDDIDRGIIKILQKDARKKFTEIGEKLGVSDATVHLRVKKLEDIGVIRKFTVSIDHSKFDDPFAAYVLISVNPGSIEEVANQLMLIKEVKELHEIYGEFEMILKIHSRNTSSLRDIVMNKIRKIPNIEGTEVFTIFKTWKED